MKTRLGRTIFSSGKLAISIAIATSVLSLALTLAGAARSANALTGVGIFELDANAVDNVPGVDEANDVFAGNAAGAVNQAFLVDGGNLANDLQFVGGASKDERDISDWQWSATGTVLDKNDLTNAFVATYVGPATSGVPNQPIYVAGVDRYANSGSASFGFWLLQDRVSRATVAGVNRFVVTDTGAVATHRVGDLLLVTNFQGSVPSVGVYKWVGGSDPLLEIDSGTNACVPGLPDATPWCGITNSTGATASPWPYTPKSGTAGIFPVDSYLEAAINLQQVLGLENLGCFSTVVAEARSSAETTAVLKDLTMTSFESCGVALTKSGPSQSVDGATVTYTFTVENTGIIPLDAVSLEDDVIGTIAIPPSCARLLGQKSCTFTYDWTVDESFAVDNVITNTAVVTYESPNGTSTVTVEDSHDLGLVTPEVSVTKAVTAGATVVSGVDYAEPGDTVTYSFTVANTSMVGSAVSGPDMLLDGGSVDDDVLGSLLDEAIDAGCDRIAAGNSCTFTANYVVDSSDIGTITGGITNTISIAYTPEGFPGTATDTAQHTLYAMPDLAIAKSDADATVSAGDSVVYTLTPSNDGWADASGVTITETVPVHTTFDAGSSSAGWSCPDGAVAGTTCTYTVGTIAARSTGSSVSFAVTANSTFVAGVATISNTASIDDDDARPDADPDADDDHESTPLVAAPDLRVTKTDGATSEMPGTAASYTVGYRNVGTQGATGVVLTETVPAGTTFDAAGSTAGWSCADASVAGTTCTYSVGALAVDAFGSITFAVNILPSATGTLTNIVSIRDDGTNGPDLVPGDNEASDSDTLVPGSDVSITIADSPDPVASGTQLTYSLVVRNNGPSTAADVTVTHTIPTDGVTLVSAVSNVRTCSHLLGTITCELGALANGAEVEITVLLDVLTTRVPDLSSTASVASTTPDPDTDNNRETEATVVLSADLSVTKTVSDLTPAPNRPVTYTITVENSGQESADGVTVTDLLPAGVTHVSSTTSVGAYNPTTGTWTVGTLANLRTETLTISAIVTATVPGSAVANVATVAQSGPGDPDPDDNSFTATFTVNHPPVADPDDVETDEDEVIAIDVVDNDTDIDGTVDRTTVAITTGPSRGSAIVNPTTGVITYTPTANYGGTDTFTYTVRDNDTATSNTATVTITINPVNDPPEAEPDSASTGATTPVSISVIANDTDIDGVIDPATVRIVTQPSRGTVTVNPTSGMVTYRPGSSALMSSAGSHISASRIGTSGPGSDTFSYEVQDDDGLVSNIATVSVLLLSDSGSVSGTVWSDANRDGTIDPSESSIDGVQVTLVHPGTDTLYGTTDDVAYPTVTAAGTYLFERVVPGDYRVSVVESTLPVGIRSRSFDPEGGLDGSANVTVVLDQTVRADFGYMNLPPVAVNDATTTQPGRPVVISVVPNDTDPEGLVLSIGSVTQGSNGTVVVNGDGTITYTPRPGFVGDDQFTYTLCDSLNACTTATVVVTMAERTLPVTGSNPQRLMWLAMLFIASGIGIAATRRRRLGPSGA